MKAYENHLRASGQQPSHSLMKEMLAGFAAAEVDKLAETKGAHISYVSFVLSLTDVR
jgi:hypothetical protein